MTDRFWRDPAPAPAAAPRVTTLAHLGGATEADFTRADTRELYQAISAAIAGGAATREDVLAALPPNLREHAEWIAAADVEQAPGTGEEQARYAAEMVTALRMLNARRELAWLQARLADDPADAEAARRVGQLATYLRDAGRLFPRADFTSRAFLKRETGKLPKRAPIAALRAGGAA